MIVCANCGHENLDSGIFCVKCARRLVKSPDDEEEEAAKLQKRIDQLQDNLVKRDHEIGELREKIDGIIAEKDKVDRELAVKHPELQDLRKKLEEKEVELQEALRKMFHLSSSVTLPATTPGQHLQIDAYPIKKPPYHISVGDSEQSIDLSTTEFRIRAKLERTSDGFELVVHDGAAVNVRFSEKQKPLWKRYAEGSRVKVDVGTVLFDPAGAMNARLDKES